MLKSDFAKRVAKENGYSQEIAHELVSAVFRTLTEVIAEGHEVNIYGFGSFGFIRRKERDIPNPIFGTVHVPPNTGVNFTPSKGLRDAVKTLDWDKIDVLNKDLHDAAFRRGPRDRAASMEKSQETFRNKQQTES